MLNIYLAGKYILTGEMKLFHYVKIRYEFEFLSPVTDHNASDNCGIEILGHEQEQFWKDHKGAKINAIRTRKAIVDSES